MTLFGGTKFNFDSQWHFLAYDDLLQITTSRTFCDLLVVFYLPMSGLHALRLTFLCIYPLCYSW